jgi:hypothetical protein
MLWDNINVRMNLHVRTTDKDSNVLVLTSNVNEQNFPIKFCE